MILFLVFAWFSPIKAQYDFDAIERSRMAQAKVKTQTEWTYDYVGGNPSTNGFRSKITKYDVRGNITEIVNYGKNGKPISMFKYQYDTRNNRISYEQYGYDAEKPKLVYSQKIVFDTTTGRKTREYGFDGSTPYNNTYTYDGGGRLAEIIYMTNNAVLEKRQFKYSGNKTEISVYNAANALISRQENVYNEQGLLMSEIKKEAQGNIMQSLKLQYNNLGDLLEEIRKRADDKLDYQKVYQYDRSNRPVKEETTNPDGSKFVSREYQYGNSGNLILEAWKKNERVMEASTNKYSYDAKGLYTEKDSYWATYKMNSLYKYVYEFF